jgi:uncharacterized protein (DUF362 family)
MDFDESRRRFFKQLALLGAGILGIPGCSITSRRAEMIGESAEGRSRVLLVQSPSLADVVRDERMRIIKKMLDAAVSKVTEAESVEKAWASLFTPNDTIGIKVNAIAGRKLSSHPELVACIADSLINIGVPPEQIIIWDRRNDELRRAGFTLNLSGKGVRCYGTDTEGVGYTDELIAWGGVATRLSKIPFTHCTAIINVPVLKDHNIAGVSLSMKNYYGAINNPNKYHTNNCDPFIADLNCIPLIREKTRLIVCDAIIAQYEKGPGYVPKYSFHFNSLLVSTDPVALDQIGVNIIEEKRKETGLPSLSEAGRPPRYIATAADPEHRLGTNDPSKMEFVQLKID